MLRPAWPRVAVPGVLVALAGVATACELALPLDGYTGSPDAAGSMESAAPPDASHDAGRDHAPPSDAPTTGDTGGNLDAEAGSGDAGGPPGDWCMAQDAGYRLCSDFDQPGGVMQGFDKIVPNGTGGSFVLDGDASVSPLRSALGVANPYPASGTGGDILIGTLWALGPTPKIVTCSLQWMPVALSTVTNDYAHILEFSLYEDSAESKPLQGFGINMRGDGKLIFLNYDEVSQSVAVTTPIPYAVKTGGWIPVTLSISLGTSLGTGHYEASVGGVAVSGDVPVLQSSSHTELEVGPAYFAGSNVSPSPGWTFAYDNVVCY